MCSCSRWLASLLNVYAECCFLWRHLSTVIYACHQSIQDCIFLVSRDCLILFCFLVFKNYFKEIFYSINIPKFVWYFFWKQVLNDQGHASSSEMFSHSTYLFLFRHILLDNLLMGVYVIWGKECNPTQTVNLLPYDTECFFLSTAQLYVNAEHPVLLKGIDPPL